MKVVLVVFFLLVYLVIFVVLISKINSRDFDVSLKNFVNLDFLFGD